MKLPSLDEVRARIPKAADNRVVVTGGNVDAPVFARILGGEDPR